MKTLVVFYSLTGNTKKLADSVAEAVAGDVLEIRLKKDLPKEGFLKYFWAGKQVVIRELPELLPLDKKPSDYGLIFLGTPVWGSNFASAVRSFLAKTKLRNKKIALFCSHGGDDSGKTFIELEKELAGNEIVAKIDFKMDEIPEAELAQNLECIRNWAQDTIKKLNR